ncbi:MAG: lamin tail domain-containing protein [Nitrosotalea sp.]
MRYLRSYTIVSFLILILIGQTYSALGQEAPIANHVVINEADINPVGDDTKYPIDWVELYNPTSSPVNISGWTIGATTGLHQTYTIPSNTIIQSKQFLLFTYGPMWFPHAGAVIQLKSASNTIIDQTPPLSDFQGGGNSWQRLTDGYDTGSSSDWVYKTVTPGSSNGQLTTISTATQNTMSITTDKTSYIFGDTVTMSGKVSALLTDPVLGYPLSVNLVVSGPSGFQKTFTLYPNNNLQFSTSMTTGQVLGFPEGNYTVSASYGRLAASSVFMLGSTPFTPPTQAASITMYVSTDQSSYTISQPITLSGTVSQVMPLTPVVYKVYTPNGTMIYQGNLFPDSKGNFTTYSQYQSHSSASGIMINSITPIYGKYTVTASYGTAKATTSFTLISQQAQTTPLIVSTNKQVYGLGETVKISGSTQLAGLQNSGLSPSLEIIQSSAASAIQGIVPQTLDVKTFVNIQPDNTFTYNFVIPSESVRLGNYRAILSTSSVQAEADFVVAANPSTYQPTTQTGPFIMTTDKTLYAYGDPIVISGRVQPNMIIQGSQIQISVFNSTGGQLYSQTSFISGSAISQSTPLAFFAYPDSSGNFVVTQSITPSIFAAGMYTLKASYGNLQVSTIFSVYNPLNTGSQGPIVANLDKQVYGVGDTVHLAGKISSLTGTSVYTLNLLQPDGKIIATNLALNNGLFSWNYTIPSQATFNTASALTTNRAASSSATSQTSLYGIYSVTINSDNGNSQLFFQVSPNPQNQTAISPFTVETDKASYLSTDVLIVSGQTLPQSNTASQSINNQVQISIYTQTGQEIYRYFASLNQGGQFHVSVPMQPGVWTTGTYKVYAQYLAYNGKTTFQVTDPFTIGSGTLKLFMTTDHNQYLPGQTVLITGRTSYIISINSVYLTFGLANDTVISEGQAVSQRGYTLQHGTASFDQYSSFSYNYVIPKSIPVGTYTAVAQVPFGFFNATYQVVNHLPQANSTSQTNTTQATPPLANTTKVTPSSTNSTQEPTMMPTSVGPTQKRTTQSMIVDKENMISSSLIPINLNEKINGNQTYYPREMDGLLRVNPSDENAVSLKVISPNGTCIIGSSPGCEVSQSTVQGSSLYQTVNIGNESLLVGFSGSDQRIQQFSLLPANANGTLQVGQWNIQIIKNDQISRFYYQVTYLTK